MLQTDAHNTNVEKKMEIDEFLKMSKNIKVNQQDSVDPTYLTMLYNSVTSSPLGVRVGLKSLAHPQAAAIKPKQASMPDRRENPDKPTMLAVTVKGAEAVCRLHAGDLFVAVEADQALGLVFEDVLFPELLPALQKVLQSCPTRHPAVLDSACSCLLQLLVLSAERPRNSQLQDLLALLLRGLCGQVSDSPAEDLAQLSQRNAAVISRLVRFLPDHFESLQDYWPELFGVCHWVCELNETCLALMQSNGSGLHHASAVVLSELFNRTPLQEVQSVYQLRSLAKSRDQVLAVLHSFFGRPSSPSLGSQRARPDSQTHDRHAAAVLPDRQAPLRVSSRRRSAPFPCSAGLRGGRHEALASGGVRGGLQVVRRQRRRHPHRRLVSPGHGPGRHFQPPALPLLLPGPPARAVRCSDRGAAGRPAVLAQDVRPVADRRRLALPARHLPRPHRMGGAPRPIAGAVSSRARRLC